MTGEEQLAKTRSIDLRVRIDYCGGSVSGMACTSDAKQQFSGWLGLISVLESMCIAGDRQESWQT
jgi:hypothetical protein